MSRGLVNAAPAALAMGGAWLWLCPGPAGALPENLKSFDVVLGQVRKDVRRTNSADALGFSLPTAAALDRGHSPTALYVSDFQNGRVLAYRDVSKVTASSEPDLIIGQEDAYGVQRYRTGQRAFSFVSGLTVDKDGTLWVADTGNGRILGFRWPFDPSKNKAENTTADVLIGAASYDLPADKKYYEVACNGGALFGGAPGIAMDNTLCSPEGLAADGAGNLYVADRQNSRVLVYQAPIPALGARAFKVLGQADLNNTPAQGPSCNRGQAAPSAETLCRPTHVHVSQQGGKTRLFVADTDNNRVLIYDDPLGDAVADAVIGQPAMTVNSPGVGAERLRNPQGVTLDGSGALWVSDTGNHRLLAFAPPFPASGAGAGAIIGQLDASGSQPNHGVAGRVTPAPTGGTLNRPRTPVFDEQGRLIVPDQDNHRVLIYPRPGHQAAATVALGQGDLVHAGESRTKARGLAYPSSIAVDRRAGGVPHVYVADYGNSRVLGWYDLGALSDGRPADLVLGQRSLADAACNGGGGAGAATLCWPRAVAVDGNGDVWVADTWNHRVLRFPRPFERPARGEQAADLVLGQASFLSGVANGTGTSVVTARGLYTPAALAVGRDGVVWVADRDNNRVVGYAPPFGNGMPASRLLIGANITSYAQVGCPAAGQGAYVCGPSGLALDADGDLWVADTGNNRAILYSAVGDGSGVLAPIPLAILGQPTVTSTGANGGVMNPTSKTMRAPEGVSVELRPSGEAAAIVVADSGNHRVLVFPPVKSQFQPEAKAVIGQDGAFDRNGYNTDQVFFEVPENVARGFWAPAGVLALPEALLIADSGSTLKASPRGGAAQPSFDGTGNNRVVIFRGPGFPLASPDAAAPADLAVSGGDDLAAPAPADLAQPAPLDPPMNPSSGGCAVAAGAGGAAPRPSAPTALAAALIAVALLRRRRA